MEKTAVLLVNLGTPDAPDPVSVRKYLREFLSDPRVIDLPRWKWLPILHGIILRVRPRRSARLYRKIWSENGSPLLYWCHRQQRALQQRFTDESVRVSLAMTYGKPSLVAELDELHRWGVRRLLILPLFPQYSSTTTASVWDGVQRTVSRWHDLPEMIFIRDYPDHPPFIDAVAARIRSSIRQHGKPDVLILSFHGIPVRYVNEGDDYPVRCRKTANALRTRFDGLSIIESFQSKFGHEEWLTPATDDILSKLPALGEKRVFLCAPSFTSDCLETLNELQIESTDLFRRSGGSEIYYVPAVNDSPLFIDCLEKLARHYLGPDVSDQSVQTCYSDQCPDVSPAESSE